MTSVYHALRESDNTPQMQDISQRVIPLLTAADDAILLNEALFTRIKQVYDASETSHRSTSQKRLTEKFYKRFVRGGALLSPENKATLKEPNQQISQAEHAFSLNPAASHQRGERGSDRPRRARRPARRRGGGGGATTSRTGVLAAGIGAQGSAHSC